LEVGAGLCVGWVNLQSAIEGLAGVCGASGHDLLHAEIVPAVGVVGLQAQGFLSRPDCA
jgi:hypothetical protein